MMTKIFILTVIFMFSAIFHESINLILQLKGRKWRNDSDAREKTSKTVSIGDNMRDFFSARALDIRFIGICSSTEKAN